MPRCVGAGIMHAMNSARTPSRLLLVADPRPGAPADGRSSGVRRFRLARLQLDSRPPAPVAKRA